MDLQLIQAYMALFNDVLQSAIVIFGSSVVLYNLGYTLQDRVTRAFTALVAFVVIVYMTELLVTHTILPVSIESWLRAEWLGIALTPAAIFHLSDSLLVTVGSPSRRRRLLVRACYLASAGFILLALFSDRLVGDLVELADAPHLLAGPLFWVFTVYFVGVTTVSVYNVWRGRQRAIIQATRRRMNVILGTMLAAPLGVYPYLLLNTNPALELPTLFWVLLIAGNIVVGAMFGMLTVQIVYFATSSSPERVVRVRLYKFMARVPLAATLVLTSYVLVQRSSSFLGLPARTASAFAVVATIIVVEGAIHSFKRPLERIFQLENDPDVRRIQQLSERVVTTRELHEYLEGILATACNSLQTQTAFVVAYTAKGPRLEKAVGPLEAEGLLSEANEQLPLPYQLDAGHAELDHPSPDDFMRWQQFWLKPLRDSESNELIGIFGIRTRDQAELTEDEKDILHTLTEQAAIALEDRVLQEKVFAAVEGLLPQITALQQRRSAANINQASLTQQPATIEILEDPDFASLVKDALSHYWGGPKLTESPLMRLQIVQDAINEHDGNPTKALRQILTNAIEKQRPVGERSWTSAEWILYNILELKFVEGRKVRDVARRLAMSESDLYRKQRVAIESVAHAISDMEREQAEFTDLEAS